MRQSLNKNTSITSSNLAQRSASPQPAPFPVHRPEAIAQRKLQKLINSSPRVAAQGRAMKRVSHPNTDQAPIQRVLQIKNDGPLMGEYKTKQGRDTKGLIQAIQASHGHRLKQGWKSYISIMAGSKQVHKFQGGTDQFIKTLLEKYKKLDVGDKKKIRPNFPAPSYDLGRTTLGIQTSQNQSAFSPSDNDAALPHRFPYSSIQESTRKFIDKQEDKDDLIRWSDRLKEATEQRLEINKAQLSGDEKQRYEIKVAHQMGMFEMARKTLIQEVEANKQLNLGSASVQEFLKWTNGLHGNIPDYGPHSTVNIPVSDRLHMHLEDGELTPGSIAAGSMTPTRTKGLAMTSDGKHLVTTDGHAVKYDNLSDSDKHLLDQHAKSTTTIEKKNLHGHDF